MLRRTRPLGDRGPLLTKTVLGYVNSNEPYLRSIRKVEPIATVVDEYRGVEMGESSLLNHVEKIPKRVIYFVVYLAFETAI